MTALVPEFAVSNIKKSLEFYVDILGFKIKYQRPESNINAPKIALPTYISAKQS